MTMADDDFDAECYRFFARGINWFIAAAGIIILVLWLSEAFGVLPSRCDKPAEKTAVNQEDVEALIRANEELIRINKKLLETVRLSNDKGDKQ